MVGLLFSISDGIDIWGSVALLPLEDDAEQNTKRKRQNGVSIGTEVEFY